MIIIITIIFLIIYIIFRVKFETKIKHKRTQVIIEVILIFLIIPICINLLMPIFQIKQLEKEEQFRIAVMDSIVKNKMNSEDIEELIFYKYKNIFESSEEEAKLWVNNFLKTLPDKKLELNSLSKKSEEYIDKLNLEWKPTCELVLKQFDNRINELIKQNENIKIEKENYNLIINVDSNKYKVQKIRIVEFPNGNSIFINFEPARIQRGILIEGIEIVFFEQLKNGYTCAVFSINLDQQLFQINPRNKRYESIDCRTNKNPMEDDNFRNKISEAINKIISSVYLLE